MLLSLLAAVALAIGGYGLLLAWQRPPAPAADVALPPPPFELPSIERLERLREFTPATAQLGFRSTATASLAVELDGGPVAGDDAGVAVIAADTLAQLGWLPLAAFAVHGAKPRAELEVPAGELLLCFAPRREAALRGYWTRSRCRAEAGGSAVPVDCRLHEVAVDVRIGGEVARGVPMTLGRGGDPDWHYVTGDGAVAPATGSDGRLLLQLGAGDYQLRPLAGSGEALPLQVPAAAPVQLDFGR